MNRALQLDSLLDFAFYLQAKMIQLFTSILGFREIDVAFISEIRFLKPGDEKYDARKFGFNFKKFHVLPWIQYELSSNLGKIRGQLFMIGLKSDEAIAKPKLTREYFLEATDKAIKKGAKFILLAANTKSIFGRGDTARAFLAKKYPNTTFLLGDNLTAAFINERIFQEIKKNGLSKEKSNFLVIAPRGLLGKSSVNFLKETLACENVYGLFNPNESRTEMMAIAKEMGVKPVFSFEEIGGNIDLVISCGAQTYYELNPRTIEKIKNPQKKLIIIDPCEPANTSKETLQIVGQKVKYYKAGNGYNSKLSYVLGRWAAWVLGMKDHVVWGCFSETFTLFYACKKDSTLKNREWFSVDAEKTSLIGEWAKKIKFSLPPES